MAIDARDAAGFYATPLGRLTAALLRRKLVELWPRMAGLSVLGIGHTGPFLHVWREEARCIAVSPAYMGTAPWPAGQPGLSCLTEAEELPFPDLSFDRIILIHGLEQAEHARRTLREAWRVLKDDGRLIVVTPNRRGLWAYAESTPFGHGQPYSEGQLTRLLSGLFFQVEARATALYAPPFTSVPLLKLFGLAERCGPLLAPQFAGLAIAEASKAMHGMIPAGKRALTRRIFVNNNVLGMQAKPAKKSANMK
ncbi:Methyltransferase domain-containing protein [Acidocella aminolytica 101 = DSM 11237]|jgi:SAM-dependent methyltransferase|uniref:Methyltransferase n=2 Tax=Acidocella TaxID=50709 RepID=A0A0D6PL05_9PROT|nr:methyltransferase domain-containing protein [Acidocella aminolytica]GAN81893.1 methyltransferase [Acidocella aminolytica 101 = DSM 11237]GBQ42599.1 SAM-dependent methyltransferase [Acidocella aminolytica 101 = DSM 11237]SHF20661.1 Methyltransferase domain-containing protein [Acidocella aminolytica 101 = DSM 11237]